MLGWKRRESELNEELEAHFQLAEADHKAAGESSAEARTNARREFGNEALVREVTRQMWGWRWLERFFADLRYAARMLHKAPGFTAVVVLTLALGIGANTAIFSVIRAALAPYAIPHAERVMAVLSDNPRRGWRSFPASAPDFLDWRASGVFSGLSALTQDGVNIRLSDRTERVDRLAVTDDFFNVLDTPPQLGRYFTADELRPGGRPVVVITDSLWHSRFAASPSVVGQSIILDGTAHTVVGVLASSFPKLQRESVYTPLVLDGAMATNRGTRTYFVIGRLRDRLTPAAASRRLTEISTRLARDYPDDSGIVARIEPIEETASEDSATLLAVLLAAVGFVLLIACANIANLVLARGTARIREMTVRSALGAGRWRLVRQLLTENLLLAFVGGLVALVPAWAGIHFIKSFEIDSLPPGDLITLNWNVLVFDFALALATGLLFGMVPAWQARKLNISDTLKAGSRGSTTGAHKRLRGVLVVCQVAFAMVLLAGAGLMVKSFLHMRSAWPGYDSHGVLTMKIALASARYAEPRQQAEFYDRLLERARALSGVTHIAAADELPITDNLHGAGVQQPDRPEKRREDIPIALTTSVTPGYLETMRIPLRRGRWFSETDRANTHLVAVVDEFCAQHVWPNEDPIGKPIKLGTKEPVREIVGVVGDVDLPLVVTLVAGRLGRVYMPLAQAPKAGISVMIRHAGDGVPLIAPMRETMRQMDPDQPLFDIRTMDEVRGSGQLPEKLAAYLLTAFAAVALALAGIGIYGVMAYSVGQRTREFGIRMSLGAQPRDVWSGVLRQGAVLAGVGIAAGLAGAFALTRLLGTLLFRIGASDPLTFAGVTVLLALVTMFAAWLPARRATRVNPVTALRDE